MAVELHEMRGFKVYMDLQESCLMPMKLREEYHVEVYNFLDRVLEKDHTFIDIGSCLGEFALFAATRCGDVFAIEAHPDNAERIEKSRKENAFLNVSVFNLAAWDKEESLTLTCNPRWSGYHSLAFDQVKKWGGYTLPVHGCRMDYINLDHTKRVAIKIDIQGVERRALEGCSGFWSKVDALAWDIDDRDFDGARKFCKGFEVVHEDGEKLLFARGKALDKWNATK